MTGTSWTTIATIGIALMGIGDALGIPAPYTAGAIISGAYFGDKLSPMSDTTVLASSIAGADLFSHIRYMLYTTIPSILLSLALYLIIGLCYDSKPVDISQYLTGLSHGFNISLLTMLVPVLQDGSSTARLPLSSRFFFQLFQHASVPSSSSRKYW